MRIDRMLAITIILLNKEKVSARELSEKFEVSIRTIYRDIDTINMAGIPIVSFPGKDGGFGILENYKIDRQVLKLDDMIAILSALKGLNITLENREIDSVIGKITTLIPEDKAAELKTYEQQFVVDILPWEDEEVFKKKMGLLHKAVVDNNPVSFSYRNTNNQVSSRVVEPMTIILKGLAWYLFGYCRLKEECRVFKISRIKELELLKETFVPKNYSYKTYFKDRKQDYKTITVKLKFTPHVQFAVEELFAEQDIKETGEDGSLFIEKKIIPDNWFYSRILGFGEHVEVLSPPEVRNRIKEIARKIIELY